jgi:hypothetical protein
LTYCFAHSRIAGDMQLTKAEIAQTQIIVTTPEKWDVVTRKPTGEGEIAFVSRIFRISLIAYDLWTQSIKLLIIDEVHLLNEERGAVIETIVARTLRQVLFLSSRFKIFFFQCVTKVESSQSMIRIVGLSATLPNYCDVADFLWYLALRRYFEDETDSLIPVFQGKKDSSILIRPSDQYHSRSISWESGEKLIVCNLARILMQLLSRKYRNL